jgi:hypothetical protein
MAIRYRPMRRKDVVECVHLIAAHPVAGPRYGNAIGDLQSAWLKLLGSEAFLTFVFEEAHDGEVQFLGGGASVFVSDEFVRTIKTPPFFWIGPELAKRVMHGEFPLLSDQEVRRANSSGGLNTVIWQLCLRPEDTKRPDVCNHVMFTFLQEHRGFVIKELIALQAIFDEELQWIPSAGALSVGRDGIYVEGVDTFTQDLLNRPHVFGLTRELAASRMGTWLGSLFTYQSPKFSFRPGEQRLLIAALRGGTDEELSNELAISLSAVKKAWHLVYERAAECLQQTSLDNDGSREHWGRERGKQKKQRLLTYLRDHPEELRPYSRKTRTESKVRVCR